MLWQAKAISAPHFYISGYFEEHKERYTELMRQVSQTGNWNEWCQFFFDAIYWQAGHNLKIAQNIHLLYEEMKSTFTETLSSKHSLAVLDFVFTYLFSETVVWLNVPIFHRQLQIVSPKLY